MKASEAYAKLAATMPEKELQENVRRAAVTLGWLCYHVHDSRHSPAGFPDLVLLRNGVQIVAELKSAKGQTTPDQDRWLAGFRATGCSVYLWRPEHWLTGAIQHVLATS